MVYFTCDKTNGCNLTFMGFNINLQTHINLHTQEYEHSATISSNREFSSKMIGKNKFHFIINLDRSGSMCSNIGSPGENKSRINLAKQCLKELVMFLYTLVTEGKEVFISLVLFNNDVNLALEYVALTTQEVCIQIMNKIDNVVATGTTNIECAILKTIELEKYEADETFKFLISDGYITTGIIEAVKIKEDYSKFYNSTIGIGNENQYDKELLKTLSIEEEERSCFNSEEMKEQIIDSVFSNVSTIAESIVINNENIIDCINTNDNINSDGVIATGIKFTTKTFMILQNRPCNIDIINVPKAYIESGGYEALNNTVDTVNNYLIGDITVSMSSSSKPDYFNIKISLDITVHPDYKSSVMEKSFRKIQSFIDISKDIISIDIDDIASFASNFKKNKTILDKITNLITYIQSQDSVDLNNYLLGVLYKFKASIEPFISNSSFRSLSDPALCTPLRMCRSQTSSGSYAFAGRQVSMGYSMSASNLIEDDVSINSQDDLSEKKDDEVIINLPDNSNHHNSNLDNSNLLYPGVNNGCELYPGAKSNVKY